MSQHEEHLLDADDANYTINRDKEIIIRPKKGKEKIVLDEFQTAFFTKVRQILKD